MLLLIFRTYIEFGVQIEHKLIKIIPDEEKLILKPKRMLKKAKERFTSQLKLRQNILLQLPRQTLENHIQHCPSIHPILTQKIGDHLMKIWDQILK